MTPSFQCYLAIIALITLLPVARVYLRESALPFLSVLLFVNMSVFPLMFSGLRQAIAISIGMLAYAYVQKKDIIAFVLYVVLAVSFHVSALILLFMYPLYYLKITKKILIAIITLVAVVFTFREFIFRAVLSFICQKYALRYLEIENTNAYNMLILLIVFAVLSFVCVNGRTASTQIKGLRNFLLLTIFIQLFASINTVVMRLGYYYLVFTPLLISNVIVCRSQRYRKSIRFAHIALLIFFTGYFFLNANFGADILAIYPYQFFWN